MGEPRFWNLVLYDVCDDRRLRRVHKLLTAWGTPVQYSVFRVRCTARDLERLRYELACELGDDDRLVVVQLCERCAGRVSSQGRQLGPLDPAVPPTRLV